MRHGLQEEPLSLPLFSHQELWTRTFSTHTFIFSFKGMGLGEEGRRGGGLVCRLLCAHLASSRGLGCGGGWECGACWKMTGARLTPAMGGTPVYQPSLCSQSSAPASPQTPVAHPSGVSVLWARGTTKRLCPALGPHPRNAKASHRHISILH